MPLHVKEKEFNPGNYERLLRNVEQARQEAVKILAVLEIIKTNKTDLVSRSRVQELMSEAMDLLDIKSSAKLKPAKLPHQIDREIISNQKTQTSIRIDLAWSFNRASQAYGLLSSELYQMYDLALSEYSQDQNEIREEKGKLKKFSDKYKEMAQEYLESAHVFMSNTREIGENPQIKARFEKALLPNDMDVEKAVEIVSRFELLEISRLNDLIKLDMERCKIYTLGAVYGCNPLVQALTIAELVGQHTQTQLANLQSWLAGSRHKLFSVEVRLDS